MPCRVPRGSFQIPMPLSCPLSFFLSHSPFPPEERKQYSTTRGGTQRGLKTFPCFFSRPPLCAIEIQLGVRRVLRFFQAWPPPSPRGGDARAPRTTRTRGVVTRGLDGHPVVGNLDTIVGCLPKSEHTGRGKSRASASRRAQTVPGNGGLPESTATHLGWMAVGRRPCVWTAKHLRDDPPGVRCARDGTAFDIRPFFTTVPATAYLRRVRAIPPRPLRTP